MARLKKFVPSALKQQVKELARRVHYRGERYQCPVCQTRLKFFDRIPDFFLQSWQEHQYIHSIFAEETLNILQFVCPACGAYDRDRLFALYYQSLFRAIDQTKRYRFVDFAPSRYLSPLLRRFACVEYRSADLYAPGVDDRVDITSMPNYSDDSFDFFLCSHVLEHIQEDQRALAELRRILKPGGRGLLMSPINLNLDEVYENPAITDEPGRWHHFGQNDHVRVYSKNGFLRRIEAAQFVVEQLGVEHFGRRQFEFHGIHPRSVLYIVHK